MRGGMRVLRLLALLVVPALIALSVGPARADSTFHTEQIPLMPVGGAPLHDGFVVDIHANGPQIYAQERYVLVGAMPNTSYEVVSQIYLDPSCSSFLVALPDASLMTGPSGDGESGSTLPPSAVGGLGGSTLGIVWQVWEGGTLAYQTNCIAVALD